MTPRRRLPTLPADIWVLVVAAFIVALGFGIISPLLPQFASSFGLGITASSIVVSSFAVFRLLFAPSAGRLLNSLGERPVYATGLLIVAASTFAVAFAQSYWQLLVFRGLGGLGSAMFSVSAMALIIRIAPPHARARATGMYATAFLLGSIAGPVLGGLMAGWGMRIPFIIYALALVLAALVVQLWLGTAGADLKRTAPKPAGTSETEKHRPETENHRPVMRFREAWRHTAYRASLFGAFANGWASMGVRMALYPLFALEVLNVGASEAGLALSVFAAGTAVAVTVVGCLADRLGRKPFALTGFLVLSASTIFLGVWDNVGAFLVLSALSGIGAGLLNPAQQASVADVVGTERAGGKVISRFQMGQDLGTILGPILAALLVDAFSYETAFIATGILALAAACAWFPARETLPGGTSGTDSDTPTHTNTHGGKPASS